MARLPLHREYLRGRAVINSCSLVGPLRNPTFECRSSAHRFSPRLLPLILVGCYLQCSAQTPGVLDRAFAEYRGGNAAKAVPLFQEYLRHNSDRADVRVFLGAALYSLSRSDEAIEQAKRALSIRQSVRKSLHAPGTHLRRPP